MVALSGVTRLPALFLTHGGGPMPLLGDPGHMPLIKLFKGLAAALPAKPHAIILISGHWEERVPTVNTGVAPPMLYDYSNFPPETYTYKYPAPGEPQLAQQLLARLRQAGLEARENKSRGYDHGVFVPLMLIYPEADIPVVCLSITSDFDAKKHIELGEAIADLRDEGVLIIGSGSSFHNMSAFRRGFSGDVSPQSKEFDSWLQETLTSSDITPEQRRARMINWTSAPQARFAQAEGAEDHFMPLHVAVGAARCGKGTLLGIGNLGGQQYSSYRFD